MLHVCSDLSKIVPYLTQLWCVLVRHPEETP